MQEIEHDSNLFSPIVEFHILLEEEGPVQKAVEIPNELIGVLVTQAANLIKIMRAYLSREYIPANNFLM